ncbi:MAG: cache domain-containing protein, partial [Nitrospiraceae bacterium]
MMHGNNPSRAPAAGTAVRRQAYSWLPALIIAMTVSTLVIGTLALLHIETRMVDTTGETLALTAAEVSDKLDRFLFERYGDALMMAGTFSPQSGDREFQSAYIARMMSVYPDYLWIGVTDARGRIVAATDPATVGQDFSARPGFQAVRHGQPIYVGDVEPFPLMGVNGVAFTAPLTGPEGEFLGVVTTRVGIQALQNVVT